MEPVLGLSERTLSVYHLQRLGRGLSLQACPECGVTNETLEVFACAGPCELDDVGNKGLSAWIVRLCRHSLPCQPSRSTALRCTLARIGCQGADI